MLFVATGLFAAATRDVPREPAGRRSSLFERHALLDAEHVLSADEIAKLAAAGCHVIRSAGKRRYLVRLDPRWNGADHEMLPVRETTALDPAMKLDVTARDAIHGVAPKPAVNVIFQNDVPLDVALGIMKDAGASIEGQPAYGPLHSLSAIVPREGIEQIAQHDEVLGVAGPRPPIVTHDLTGANLSLVTPLFSDPYNLSGAGVVLSMWDSGRVDTSHSEFGGRVTAETTSAIQQHPTHVAGIMAARGLYPSAKGMAPQVSVYQFDYNDNNQNWWVPKDTNFAKFGVRADNNSWGYGDGWADAHRTYWEWWGDDLFGAYVFESSQIDYLTRAHGTLVVFSAGNELGDTGPQKAPFPHYHASGSTVFCYSADGTGNDCPAGTCAVCELTPHPPDGPCSNSKARCWDTVDFPGTAKDSITVGSLGTKDSALTISGFSSRGPVAGGRIKPDLVADGYEVISTLPGGAYGVGDGTSMAAPAVTGIAALVIEQWRRTMGGGDPPPEVTKALLIDNAEDLGAPGPDYVYGFGLVQAQPAIDAIIADAGSGSRIAQGSVDQGTAYQYGFDLGAGGSNRLTLVWTDPEYPLVGFETASDPLINDLDLEVIGPGGQRIYPYVLDPNDPNAPATTGVNHVDNVEQIDVSSTSGGHYVAVVRGSSIPQGPQAYALVSTASLGPRAMLCDDPYEPNDTQGTAWGMLKNGIAIYPTLCTQDDVDYYELVVDRSGPVSVLVASDSAILATLMNGSTVVAEQTVTAGSKSTLTTSAGTGTGQAISPVTYFLRVEASGTLSGNGHYLVRATYQMDSAARTRPVRRP